MTSKEESKDAGETNAHTVFVRNLPFSTTDSGLQEFFSEVGPVRRCFLVKEKGSDKHRGFGFVQYALVEHATSAVETMNGVNFRGHKIKVELAKKRASFEARRSRKEEKGTELPAKKDNEEGMESISLQDEKISDKKRKRACEDLKTYKKSREDQKLASSKVENELHIKQISEKERSSEKQSVARTVILGGLINPEMKEKVVAHAKKLGSVESVRTSLTMRELEHRGLKNDGCTMEAVAVVYKSVKAACLAVKSLHREVIGDGVVWARQLGGEGSKTRRWRVIVRNIPFQVTGMEIQDLFSSAGFVWEVTIPRASNGESKGFGFIAFTSKADAQNAINTINGKQLGKRTVAVDWAVSKNQYKQASEVSNSSIPPGESTENHVSDVEDEETASEDEEDDEANTKLSKKVILNESLEEENENGDTSNNSIQEEPDILGEIDMAKRVLNKVVAAGEQNLDLDDMNIEDEGKEDGLLSRKKKQKTSSIMVGEVKKASVEEEGIAKKTLDTPQSMEVLKRTVFIRNIPFNLEEEALKSHFSMFGVVKSLKLVRHAITKRPKGSAFLEFASEESTQKAIAAAAGDENDPHAGIILEGRRVIVLAAAPKSGVEAFNKEDPNAKDKRNLYLTKEGQIQEGTRAAEGVSEADMQKRKELENEKSTKLRSPIFHVSRTRLAVYNVPRSMNEAQLQTIFIDAVKSRATQQNPVIKQLKILKDETKGGRSRGVAFVDFTEHQHALVALRVLNNNPTIFSNERRPIVGFAIENVKKLQLLNSRPNADIQKSFNRKPEGIAAPLKEMPGNKRGATKGKKNKDYLLRKSSIETVNDGEILHNGTRNGKLFKGKSQNQSQKPETRDVTEKRSMKKGSGKKRKPEESVKSDDKRGQKLGKGKSQQDKLKSFSASKEHRFATIPDREERMNKDKKKRYELEHKDKLDKLVQEYHSRYFSVGEKPKSSNSDYKDLHRWFE